VHEDGATADAVDVRRPVGIEIGFNVSHLADTAIYPKIKVMDRQGHPAFNAIDTDPRWQEPTEPGDYVTTAWIPANLLNEGYTSVEVAIVSISGSRLYPRASVFDAVSFHVQDLGEGDSARGIFTGEWKGVVRPLLEWTTDEL
jgi:lipopolysaccharide transport system ATP-binding protein